ncbi:MAG: InlB B-repeat-containing protein, partial [Candidatus Scatosoma sp.]
DRGNYNIELSGFTSDNYNIRFVTAILTVKPLSVVAPTVNSMSYTGGTLIPEIAASQYYFVKTNEGGINVGRYAVVLSLRDYPNTVWFGDESSADKSVYYEIVKTFYTVTFVQEGGNYVKGDIVHKVMMGETVAEANVPAFIRNGFVFGGWYTDKAFTNKFSVTAAITTDTVLYGQWIKNDGALAGRVVDNADEGIKDVVVNIMKNGKVLFSVITNDGGYFSTDGVNAGVYNFVLAYTADDVDRAMVFAINVTGSFDEMIKIVLDSSNVNTRVSVDSKNVDFVVDDLQNGFTKADLENVKVGGSVEFLIEILEREFDKVNDFSNAAGLERKSVNGYFNVKASKQSVSGQGVVSSSEVQEIDGLVKIVIKLDEKLLGKTGYVLFREAKNGGFETIGAVANDKGEYVKLSDDGKTLEAYLTSFGDYAVGYDTANLSVTVWSVIAAAAGVATIGMLVVWIVAAKKKKSDEENR